jgi:hypothetical protein
MVTVNLTDANKYTAAITHHLIDVKLYEPNTYIRNYAGEFESLRQTFPLSAAT